VSAVSTPAPLACVRCSPAGRVRGVHCFRARVCAGARIPRGGLPALPCGAHYARAMLHRVHAREHARFDPRSLEGALCVCA
jgi:hypothetical protein